MNGRKGFESESGSVSARGRKVWVTAGSVDWLPARYSSLWGDPHIGPLWCPGSNSAVLQYDGFLRPPATLHTELRLGQGSMVPLPPGEFTAHCGWSTNLDMGHPYTYHSCLLTSLCLCVCLFCACVRLCLCMPVYASVYSCVCLCMCLYASVWPCVPVCVPVCLWVVSCVCLCECTCLYTCVEVLSVCDRQHLVWDLCS